MNLPTASTATAQRRMVQGFAIAPSYTSPSTGRTCTSIQGWIISHEKDAGLGPFAPRATPTPWDAGLGPFAPRATPCGWHKSKRDAHRIVRDYLSIARDRTAQELADSTYNDDFLTRMAARLPWSRAPAALDLRKLRREEKAKQVEEQKNAIAREKDRETALRAAAPKLLAALKGLLAAPTDASYEAAVAAVAEAEAGIPA